MRYRKFFITILIVVLLSSLASLSAPFFLQCWENNNVPLTIHRIGFIVAIIVVSKLLSILLTVYRERSAKEYNKKNFGSILDRFFHMDYDSIIKEGPTNLLEKISIAVNSIYSFMTSGFITIWSSSIVALIVCCSSCKFMCYCRSHADCIARELFWVSHFEQRAGETFRKDANGYQQRISRDHFLYTAGGVHQAVALL